MNRRRHHSCWFLLFFTFSCIFFQPKVEAFPYQSGWPKDYTGRISSSPVIADLDQDGSNEVLFSVNFNWRICIYKGNGDVFNSAWPKSFPNDSGTIPVVADIDGDGDLEIIAGSFKLYAWHHTGEDVDGFPVTVPGGFSTSPVIGDLTGDEIPEIAAGISDCRFFVWDNLGNVLNGFPKTFTGLPACGVSYSPAIGDIDLDGINEVIVQVFNEHVYAFNSDGTLAADIWDVTNAYGYTQSDITVGDIDSDNILEVLMIANSQQGEFYPVALNHDTTYVAGWPPQNLNNISPGGLVMGDIDEDGKLEVVTGTQQFNDPATVYVWEGETGQIKTGWPVVLPSNNTFFRNMILGDVDGDGDTDILGAAMFGLNSGKIYAWDANGTSLSGFPISINGFGPWTSTCFITDLDKDGDVEIGVGVWDTYSSSKLIIWDLPSPYKGKRMPWPQDRHDPGHTNNYHWYRPLPQVPALLPLGLFIIVTLLSVAIYLKTR